ncbi:MAG: hypothetical protein AABY22_01775, partial [Nanoarchaeota archaeon]
MPFNIQGARQAGYSDEQINSFLATKQTNPAPTGAGGGLTDWLPTIGAIGGSFLGGPLLGGALGAGAGTLLKQEITGKGDLGELAKESALGLGGGLLGKGISKIAGKTVGKLAGQVAAKTGGGVTQKLATKTLASNFTIPPKIAPQLRLEESLGQMIQDGVKIPNSIKGYQNMANQITGDRGIITNAQRLATKDLKIPINYDEPLTVMKESMSRMGALTPDERLDTLATARNYFNNRPYPAIGHVGADDALDIANALDKEGYNLLNKGLNELSPNPMLEARGEAFIGVAEDLRSQISRGIDSTGIFKKVQIEAVKELYKISPQLAQRAAAATNMGELRSVAGPYVRINRAAQSTINRQQTPFVGGGLQLGTRMGGAIPGLMTGNPL